MKKLLAVLIRSLAVITGRKNMERFLVFCARSINANLHVHGLLQIGSTTGLLLDNDGEHFFIANILPVLIDDKTAPVLFDVGANIGSYTLFLKGHIANGAIYSFEPVPETYRELQKNITDNTHIYNIGFGNEPGKGTLYNASNTVASEIATMHKDVLTDAFEINEFTTISFDIDTIDNFCSSKNISTIDFLKLDVEGNELAILQGATKMLDTNNIKIIQFEINAHNVYSRVFLRDFYLLLKDFDLYRLNRNSLVSLGQYQPINEIFTAQNIVAVHKTLSPKINSKFIW
jgi:FkbM family methyltransferase